MVRLFRPIAIIVLTMILASPAYSYVVNITEYRKDVINVDTHTKSKVNECTGIGCTGFKTATCDNAQNEYDDPQFNAVCEKFTKFGEETCYKCYCADKYQFTESQCTSEGFAKGADYCTLGDKKYYETCNCNSTQKYMPLEDFAGNVSTNFTYTSKSQTGVKGLTRTCLKYDSFTCKTGTKMTNTKLSIKTQGSGSSTFTVSDDSSLITYKGNLNTKTYDVTYSTVCVTGVSAYAAPLYSSSPSSQNACAVVKTGKPNYVDGTYYYFDGSCSETAPCIGTNTADCTTILSPSVAWYSTSTLKEGGTIDCKKVTGCSAGMVTSGSTKYICVGTYAEKTGMDITKISAGGFNCGKLIGCASGYTPFGDMANAPHLTANNQRLLAETARSPSNLSKDKYIYEAHIKESKDIEIGTEIIGGFVGGDAGGGDLIAPASLSAGDGNSRSVINTGGEVAPSSNENVDFLICRKPIGCGKINQSISYIDTETCWSGCAAWFIKK